MSQCLSLSGQTGWLQVSHSNVNHLLKVYRRAPTAEAPGCANIIGSVSLCLSLGCRNPCVAGGGAACDRWSWLWLICLPGHSINNGNKKERGRGGCLFGPGSCKNTSLDIQTLHFWAGLSLPVFGAPFPSLPFGPLLFFPIFLTIMGGVFMIRAGDGDPAHPIPRLRHLLSVCRRKIGQPFNISPSPSRQPPPSLAQPGSTRAASLLRRSALYTLQCAVDWWQAIWDLPAAAVPVSSSAAFFMAVKKQFLLPLISPPNPSPFSSTHSTILPLPPPPYLLLIPSC